MKRIIAPIIFLLLITACPYNTLFAQRVISGNVQDEKASPLINANVFIKETLEGTSSDEMGNFSIESNAEGTVTLCVMMLGYETLISTIAADTRLPLTVKMCPVSVSLDNVEVVASNFLLKGSSQWSKMDAVDLVTTGGSNGDLYKSITTLPGTQIAGEDGRLFIRGGDSREAQTYIDDMHVLNPYTTTSENNPVRGRYSPFMFEGMNFSLGGYDPEYAQSLSSVLPLTTKDESPVSKYGTSISTVGLGGGGNGSFRNGSVSLNLDYQNLAPYVAVFPDRTDWKRPYQNFSGGTQLRYKSGRTVCKLYAGYDYTSFALQDADRKMDLKENNCYLNTTFRHEAGNGYKLFAGAAFSLLKRHINGASIPGDLFRNKEYELHVKLKAEKRYSRRFRLQLGAETFFRGLDEGYTFQSVYQDGFSHTVNGLFANANLILSEHLNAAVSSRMEYTSVNKQWNYMPRVALNYDLSGFLFSGIAGRYSQLTYTDYLLRDPNLPSESCWHYIVGAYHQSAGRIYRLEAYYKDYDRLICDSGDRLDDSGSGYSKGIDLFFNDASLVNNLEYRLSYSLNYSKRKYRDMPYADVPQYATRHNASLSLRYNLRPLRSIVSVTNRFASGRPYHDPNQEGYMNATAPCYNSLDLGITVLVNKKLIVYASASNLLGRKQIYNYTWPDKPDGQGHYTGTPVHAGSDHFFFIGVFITLGGNTAYDVSNF